VTSFLHEDFLLESDMASDLYHAFVQALPIIDYHCHLPVERIAADHRFRSLTEIWLEGDHYKWRAMRANGVREAYCTGGASPFDKFMAWARTVPFTLRNPLYHWTHLELKRYFGIDSLLDEATVVGVVSARHEDDGRAVEVPALDAHVEPGHVGKLHVEQDDIGSQVAQHRQRGGAVLGLADHLEAVCLEHRARGGAEARVVVDDEDGFGLRTHEARKVIVTPFPLLDSLRGLQ